MRVQVGAGIAQGRQYSEVNDYSAAYTGFCTIWSVHYKEYTVLT